MRCGVGPLLLAIDVGTGSCRAVLFDTKGNQLAAGQREYVHPAVQGVPGSQNFDTATNWRLICDCIREALIAATAAPASVAAVAATSMREGMVLYGPDDTEIWACPNIDSRAADEARELVSSGAAQEIYAHAGDWVAITAPARFLWLARRQPEILEATKRMGMLADWVTTRLCGEFSTEASIGSSSGMFELSKRQWSDKIIDLCGLDGRIFPPVVEAGSVVGAVTPQAAYHTGLRAGTPVVAAGADTQLALVGLGTADPSRATIVGGSHWQLTTVLDAPVIDPQARLRTLCHTIPDRWMIEGIGFACGLVMRWFRDGFCDVEKLRASSAGKDPYEFLEGLATELPPGANGVFGIFSNVMQASRWIHAAPAFVGFDVSDPAGSALAACFRAIEESAAYVSLAHLRVVEELVGVGPGPVTLTGGAAKGVLWPHIVADALGVPVEIPVVKESTALGAAIYAGVGAGLWRSPGDATAMLSGVDRVVDPDGAKSAAYETLFERWLELNGALVKIADRGVARPLWRAAGT